MLCVGIISNEQNDSFVNLLLSLFKANRDFGTFFLSRRCALNLNEANKKALECASDVFIAELSDRDLYNLSIGFDILIYLSSSKHRKSIMRLNCLKEHGLAIINADEESIFPLSVGIGRLLISCGFNSRASVTASSVCLDEGIDGAGVISCCIQRTIKTLNGTVLEPQEIPVFIRADMPEVPLVLAAVTAAIFINMELSALNFTDGKIYSKAGCV